MYTTIAMTAHIRPRVNVVPASRACFPSSTLFV